VTLNGGENLGNSGKIECVGRALSKSLWQLGIRGLESGRESLAT
jgi:hypothetical protein